MTAGRFEEARWIRRTATGQESLRLSTQRQPRSRQYWSTRVYAPRNLLAVGASYPAAIRGAILNRIKALQDYPLWKRPYYRLALRKRERSEREEWQNQVEMWAMHWIAAGIGGDAGGVRELPPELISAADLPPTDDSCQAQFRRLAFKMKPGSCFADFERLGPRIAPALGAQIVVIERYPVLALPMYYESPIVFTVSYELCSTLRWPARLFSNELDWQTAWFLHRSRVVNAFCSVGLPSPIPLQMGEHSQDCVSSIWALPLGASMNDVEDRKETILEGMPGCDWLDVGKTERGHMLLTCGLKSSPRLKEAGYATRLHG